LEDGAAYRFRLIGGLWSIRFGDEAASVRDYDGMR
jgi:hypothetical protein